MRLRIEMKGDRTDVWENDKWDDYYLKNGLFIILFEGRGIGFYNIRYVKNIVVEGNKNEE